RGQPPRRGASPKDGQVNPFVRELSDQGPAIRVPEPSATTGGHEHAAARIDVDRPDLLLLEDRHRRHPGHGVAYTRAVVLGGDDPRPARDERRSPDLYPRGGRPHIPADRGDLPDTRAPVKA